MKEHDVIPPALTKTVYAQSLKLHAEGLGAGRIAARLSTEHGLRLAPGTISHWIAGDRRPRRWNVFQHRPSGPLSYVIGANLGDGCRLERTGCVKLEVTDLDFAEAFNKAMATVFSRETPNRITVRRFSNGRLPLYTVRYVSRQLLDLLTLPLKDLLDIAFAHPREFLRGFFDAEGHVDVAAVSHFMMYVGAENSNRYLLARAKAVLFGEFSIRSAIVRKRKAGSLKVIRGTAFRMRKPSYSLLIRRIEDVKKFQQEVGFSIARKNEKLSDALFVIAMVKKKERSNFWRTIYMRKRGKWLLRTSEATVKVIKQDNGGSPKSGRSSSLVRTSGFDPSSSDTR